MLVEGSEEGEGADGSEAADAVNGAAGAAEAAEAADAAPSTPRVVGVELRSPFQLASADGLTTEFTNFVRGYSGALDYVWCAVCSSAVYSTKTRAWLWSCMEIVCTAVLLRRPCRCPACCSASSASLPIHQWV